MKQTDEKTTIIERITQHRSVAAGVGEALARAAPERRVAAVEQRVQLRVAHREQPGQHRDEADGVDREAPSRRPTAAIMMPASAGPKMRAVLNRLELSAIAFGQLVATDHLERQVLARRRIEDERRAGERSDRVDLPQLHVSEQRDRREHGGEEHLHRLGDDHDAAVVESVGDDAGEQPEERERPEAADR